MFNIKDLRQSLVHQPAYTLMRGAARFGAARAAVCAARRTMHGGRVRRYLDACQARLSGSVFADFDRTEFVSRLRADGVAFGLNLPAGMVGELTAFALANPCFADREPERGFYLENRMQAQVSLGKPILVAQYFNTETSCAVVSRLRQDAALQWIAGTYLESVPTFVGANLWWTFPVKALEEDRDRHAHLFHRDVDDFRFFKFFFYLTPVSPGEGAHVCVAGSHLRPPVLRRSDHWRIRRYSDREIASNYPAEQIIEICGPAGTGFAENTLCIHKGRTPGREPRLLLQLQYALFDYGVGHDRRRADTLHLIG